MEGRLVRKSKKLACTIIPLEEILILFSRIISAKVRSNLAKLGVTILEREGSYFVRYEGEIIFVGDKGITEGFISQALEKDEIEAIQYLRELKALAKKKVELKLKKNSVLLENFTWVRFKYVKRLTSETDKLRSIFNYKVRQKFINEVILSNPENVTKLKKLGMNELDIKKLQDGFMPKGWQVHHKYSLDDSGTNDLFNLILIKNDPFHKSLTVYQNSFAQKMKAGDAVLVDWPIHFDIIYP